MTLFRHPLLILSDEDAVARLPQLRLADLCDLLGCRRGTCEFPAKLPIDEIQSSLTQLCPDVPWSLSPRAADAVTRVDQFDLVIPWGVDVTEFKCALWHAPVHSEMSPGTILAIAHEGTDVIPLAVQLARSAQGRLLIASSPSSPEDTRTVWDRVQPALIHLDWRTIPGGVRAIDFTDLNQLLQVVQAEHVSHTVAFGQLDPLFLSALTVQGSAVLQTP